VRRFLLVGCGGSGGATLQFVMDQLRADLAQRGIHRLPQAWQFVHVDVPRSPDGIGKGMPPTVPAQGGRYVGLANPGANYPGVAQSVEANLRNVNELAQLATWRPDPSMVRVPIAAGAGQQRAIGRILSIARAANIVDKLGAAFDVLRGGGVTGELAAVADQFSPSTRGQVADPPVVLVVSSMAGGAGASMVLDVCRLMTQQDGYDARATGLFLFTPEVFASLPANARGGVEGNALAMAGELIAAQTGAATSGDAAVLGAMGLPIAGQIGVPFGRVFPVGARVGASGAPFGDGSAVGVYRGLGRGLAALMLSGQATVDFVNYDITNVTPQPTQQDALGWSVDPDMLLWGSFGFASLGLGRERYAEYAAQRLARAAVDRLVDGHLQPGDTRPATDQLRTLNDARWTNFEQRAGLPSNTDEVRDWFVSLLSAAPLESAAAATVEETVGRHVQLPQPVDFRTWFPVLQQQIAQDGNRMRDKIDAIAYTWAFDWHHILLEMFEAEISRIVVDSGLAAARDMVMRVIAAADGWIHALQHAPRGTDDVHLLPAEVRQKLAGIKGMVDSGSAALEVIRSAYVQNVLRATRTRCAANAASVLQEMRTGLLKPLAKGCDEALQALMAARTAVPVDTGLARLQTDEYIAWPEAGTQIPRRFFEAHNEVLLTSAEDFPREFDAHIAATEPGRPARDRLHTIVDQIIRGRWETTGAMVDGQIIERLSTWRPGMFPRDPHDAAAPPSLPRAAQYRIAVRPAEVLDRARAWIERPDEPFDSFISQSLRDYVTGTDVGEAEYGERNQQVNQHFAEALEMARPLVAVNASTVGSMHGLDVRIAYKFSDVPLAGLPLGGQLVDDLRRQGEADDTSMDRLERAMRSDSRTTRIDIFSSYGRLSPATFSSLLAPLDKRWTACVSAEARSQFWKLRRARRLPGCLPMGDAQRRAIVGGWWVARLTGQLRLPAEHSGPAVEVWDADHRSWVAFPHPLLISDEDFQAPTDVLGAVLLSSLVALARCHQYPGLDPLRPYTMLRRMWDNTINGSRPDDPALLLAAARPMTSWLRTGETPPGAPVPKAGTLVTPTPEDRRANLQTTLEQVREKIGKMYLSPGQLGAAGGGDFSQLDRPDQLSRVPLYHELAPDVYSVLGRLIELVAAVSLDDTDGQGWEFDKALG